MEAAQIIDALSASFFSLLGIWAAVDKRHWFLRVTVVGAFLLVNLLLPAYEVVIEFGVAIALIMAGIGIARRDKGQRPRFSMQSIMLLMVVVAVACSVLASAPYMTRVKWLTLLGTGMAVASIALTCLWVVYSKKFKWRSRVIVGLFVLAMFTAATHLFSGIYSTRGFYIFSWQKLTQYYSWDVFQEWFPYHFATSVLAILIISGVLLLARGSQWFGFLLKEADEPVGGREISCRIGLSTLVLATFLPLAYLYYCLMTPEPLPEIMFPVPNGYDDFIAAGKMVSDETGPAMRYIDTRPFTQFEEARNRLSKAVQRIEQGLSKNCLTPHAYTTDRSIHYYSVQEPLGKCQQALLLEILYHERTGNTSGHTQACLRLLRFVTEADRGGKVDRAPFQLWDPVLYLHKNLSNYQAAECRYIALELAQIDEGREPYSERVARRRIYNQHQGWKPHLRQILSDWTGKNRQYREPYENTQFRLYIADFAIHAYLKESGQLPNSLTALVPEYLPHLPLDLFGEGAIKYLRENSNYKLYSVGWDGEDDLGKVALQPSDRDADIVLSGPIKPLK